MDGYEATRRIRAMHENSQIANIPIVAMTAHAQREDRERCLAMGMNHYVTKPIDLGELVTVIESYEKGLPNVKSGVMSFLRPAKEKNKKRDSEKSMENDGKNIYTSVQNESSILLEELEEAISAQDHDRLERTAEELKLLAEKVGAVNVRDEAFLLKMAARRKTLDRAHTQISNVREELTRFMDEATMILESGKKES
ncbi:MAG TPA: hybrid sensor histidine kinase/response regulator, partial [Spirochaetia bacterium]|nr:hybrid sensor histidine kinase/response regulator [Spirochaetia bacterium]